MVREALRLLQQRQEEHALRLDRLRREIAEGFARGEAEPLGMAAIKAEARAAQR